MQAPAKASADARAEKARQRLDLGFSEIGLHEPVVAKPMPLRGWLTPSESLGRGTTTRAVGRALREIRCMRHAEFHGTFSSATPGTAGAVRNPDRLQSSPVSISAERASARPTGNRPQCGRRDLRACTVEHRGGFSRRSGTANSVKDRRHWRRISALAANVLLQM